MPVEFYPVKCLVFRYPAPIEEGVLSMEDYYLAGAPLEKRLSVCLIVYNKNKRSLRMNMNPKGNPNPRREFLEPAEMGNQRARKHSDLQIAEVIALREKYKIGYGQISYLTGIPKSTVEKYIKGERTKNLMSSNEFNQKVQEIKRGLSKYPPASRKGVQETKAEMRARLRKERQDRLADEAIPHTPVPTQKQVQVAAMQRAAAIQQGRHGVHADLQQPARDRDAWNQEWIDNLNRAGVPIGAPKHVIQKYRPTWRPER